MVSLSVCQSAVENSSVTYSSIGASWIFLLPYPPSECFLLNIWLIKTRFFYSLLRCAFRSSERSLTHIDKMTVSLIVCAFIRLLVLNGGVSNCPRLVQWLDTFLMFPSGLRLSFHKCITNHFDTGWWSLFSRGLCWTLKHEIILWLWLVSSMFFHVIKWIFVICKLNFLMSSDVLNVLVRQDMSKVRL